MNALISEQDAHCLLVVPFRRPEEEVRAYARRQEQILFQASKSWEALMAALKQSCRAFCSRVEPDFEPFLQEVLLISSKRWFPFPSWDHIFSFSTGWELHNNLFILQKMHWWLEVRINILQHPKEWIEKIILTFYGIYRAVPRGEPGLFLRELSGEEAAEYVKKVYQEITPPKLCLEELSQRLATKIFYDKKGKRLFPSSELGMQNLDFLKDTPFYFYLKRQMPLNLALKPRYESQWNIGAQGSGKTQLLQRMICDDIEHGRSVVVMDSQRDMINKLLRLKHSMEIVLIDPEDIEYPPGIALFDIDFGTGGDAEGQQTHVMDLYKYMFSVLGTELTGRQGSLFDHALALMFDVPESNIYTLIDLFRGDKSQFKRYWEKMDERKFFDTEFFEPKYKVNRDQILAKLNILTSPGHKTLRRILGNKKNKIDFFALLNRPVAIFVNTSQKQLGVEGCALFGRFILALLVRALVARSVIPEDQRNPTFIYVDEGKDYGNDDAFERIIYQCRKQKAGLIFCSQNIGQLSKETATALFTSSIKFVRSVKEPAETRKLSQALRIEDGFLHDLHTVDNQYSEWACQIGNQKTVKARVDFGYLENQPKITEAEYQKLREENRRKYCVKAEEAQQTPGIRFESPAFPTPEQRANQGGASSPSTRENKPAEDDDYFA